MQLTICNPCMEAAGHELCFISHPGHERRISCNVFGRLRTNEARGGWEVWRFTKVEGSGNFVITSWVHDDKVLCSNEEGEVHVASKKKLSEGEGEDAPEEWTIALHPVNEGVTIRSAKHGRLLAIDDQDIVTIVEGKSGYDGRASQDTWQLDPAHSNHFFVTSKCHNKVLSSITGDELTTRQKKESSEKWVIETAVDATGKFTICSLEHGKYLGSSKDGELIIGESRQYWYLSPSPHGSFIRSAENGGWLSCNDEGILSIAKANNVICETWCLEPIMPRAMSDKQFWSLARMGVATATAAVSMPFAVMGVVGVLGFGAAGIAPGSIAAGMMSAEAIAGGGAVAAGGTVATLQSIGAAGLGVVGTSAAAGTGAVVGGGLSSLGLVTATKGLENKNQGIKIEEPQENLPLCAWRMWK